MAHRPALILLLVLLGARSATARPLVVLLGESTTANVGCAKHPAGLPWSESAIRAEVQLRRLLKAAPATCPFRRAYVVNWALPSTPTWVWTTGLAGYCSYYGPGFLARNPLARRACGAGGPVAEHIVPLARARYRRAPDAILLTAGTNDYAWGLTPAETVDNLETLIRLATPTPVRLSPPLPRTYQQSNVPGEIRQIELDRGLLSGPDWHRYPLPLCDGLHQTDGGWIAFAAQWYDVLCPTPTLSLP